MGMPSKPWPFNPAWQVNDIWDAEAFFAALPLLVPFPFYLRLNGAPDREIRLLFKAHEVGPLLELRDGTVSVTNNGYHVLATRVFLRELSELAGRHAAPEICMDMHAYGGGRIFVEWYDALSDNPLLVADEITEAAVRAFCEALDVSYEPADEIWRRE
jgi:hypothetical protein